MATDAYREMRDEFTADEIREFVGERLNVAAVILLEGGILLNPKSYSEEYGWRLVSDRMMADLLDAMRKAAEPTPGF